MRRAPWIAAMLFWAAACLALSQSPDEPMAILLAGRYDELEDRFQSAQDSYKRGESSDEQLLASFRPFYDVSDSRYLAHLEEWVREKPRSYVAHLALGIHLKYIGLDARGDQPLSVTPDAQVKVFHEAFRRAADVLDDSLSLDDRPLLSYHHLIDPNGALPMLASNRILLDEAVKLDPRSFIVRRKYLLTLPARWGGNLNEMQQFIEECRTVGFSATQIAKLERDLEEERAYLAFRRRDFADAEIRYTALVAQDPEDHKSRIFLLTVLSQLRKCDQAIALADQILRDNPANTVALGNRGLCHVRQERFEAGIADYRAAAERGDTWAQRELARLHWQGRLVKKDRKLALELLRRASESGDAEAQKELERITGERVATKVGERDAIVPMAWIAGPLVVAGLATLFVRRRAPADVVARRLQFSLWRYWGVALCFVFLGGAVYLGLFTPSRDRLMPLWLLLIVGVMAWLARDAARTLLLRHDLLIDGIRTSGWGRAVELKWAELVRFDHLWKKSTFRLFGPDGRITSVDQSVMNVQRFAQEALSQVPVMDEGAYYSLKEILDPDYCAEHPDEDDLDGDDQADGRKA